MRPRTGADGAGGAVRWARAAALGAALLAVPRLAAGHEPPPAPTPLFEPPPVGSYELPVIGRVSQHWLTASDGSRAPLPGIDDGEVAVVSFVYSRCAEACPLGLAALQRLDRALAARPDLAARTRLLTVSFDPAHDTPARMAELRRHLAPRVRWSFLTAADPDALAPVLDDFGQDAVVIVDEKGDPSGRLRHVLKVYLVDSRGAVRNIYSTGFLDTRILLNDVDTLLRESPPPRPEPGAAR